MTISRVLAATLALAASSAAAQTYTVQPPLSQTYAPLVGATTVTVSSSDDGYVTIPLGFTFPYYGSNYTSVHANANGFLAFGNTAICQTNSGCYNGDAIPSTTRTTNIHNLIAPWWDDLSISSPGSIRYLQAAGQIEIEYATVRNLGSSYTFSFTVKLTSAGVIEIKYGTFTGTGGSATVGFENATGSAGSNFLGCSATASSCAQANWPTNTVYVIGQPVQPDIVVTTVNIASLVVDGTGNITFNVTPTFQNYGQNPTSSPFAWKAYLSTDKVLGGDILVYTSPSNVTLTGAGSSGAIAMATGAAATTSPPAPGQYYVIVDADPAPGVVTEASELNNVGTTANYFVNGLDLVATGVSGPVNSGPGNPMVVNVKYFNQGTAAPPAPLAYRVLLSLDTVVSTTDFVLYSSTRAITGGETVDENVSFNVPGNVPGGDFYYILQLDPGNTITEASETNNAFVSTAKVTMKQADLVNISTDFLDPVTASPSRIGYFGQAARSTVTIQNVGGANAVNFKVGVIVSTDATLSLLSDTIAFEADVPLVAQGTSVVVDIPFMMPLMDRNGVIFPTGNYFLFTILDSRSAVTELNEANNTMVVMGTVQLRAPAPDLTVTRLEAPASGAVGEIIPLLRGLKNIGNINSPAVKYRYFASANAIITPDDVPLLIMSGGAGNLDGTVTLPIGMTDTQTDLVKLPPTMPAGTYYLGAIIDTAATVAEIDESNNALASNTVAVAPSSLRVSTSQLPDAVVDRPYNYQLVALGEQGGASTWSIDPSQGTLPPGMSLGTDGQISGKPTMPSVNGFTVVVTNNGRDGASRLVLRVLPTTTQVEITTTSLPAMVNTTTLEYKYALGAAGGVKPYAWKVVSGTLPQSLILTNDGVLSGFPKTGLAEGASNVTLEVQDSLGTRAQKSLSMRVIAPGSIVFKTLSLPAGLVGEDYGTDIAVQNADMTAIATVQKPLVWTKQGELPDGLRMMPVGDVLSIEGKPLRAGIFTFTITVEDSKGRSDTAEFLIRVSPARFKLASVGLPELARPGEVLAFAITATTQANPKFTLYSGRLAPGLTMAADGKVTGMIPLEPSPDGTYNFVVEAIDDTGATGLGAFSLEVKREVKPTGCSCNAGFGEVWLLALVLPFAMRRRSSAKK
jgi:hypothetical protein